MAMGGVYKVYEIYKKRYSAIENTYNRLLSQKEDLFQLFAYKVTYIFPHLFLSMDAVKLQGDRVCFYDLGAICPSPSYLLECFQYTALLPPSHLTWSWAERLIRLLSLNRQLCRARGSSLSGSLQ